MSKYVFIKEKDKDNPASNTRVQMDVEAALLPDLLEAFEDFLKGAGYSFSGHLDIVDEVDITPPSDE